MDQKNPEERKAYKRAWYAANKDKAKAYYEANKDKRKAWLEANKEKIRAKKKAYNKANRDKRNATEAKREALKILATLPTSDYELIKKLYEQRVEMSEKHGEQYHVDHIIPLSIGGAHHQDNLRVITAKENVQKNDKYIPELGGVWADNDLARETKKRLGIK